MNSINLISDPFSFGAVCGDLKCCGHHLSLTGGALSFLGGQLVSPFFVDFEVIVVMSAFQMG